MFLQIQSSQNHVKELYPSSLVLFYSRERRDKGLWVHFISPLFPFCSALCPPGLKSTGYNSQVFLCSGCPSDAASERHGNTNRGRRIKSRYFSPCPLPARGPGRPGLTLLPASHAPIVRVFSLCYSFSRPRNSLLSTVLQAPLS